MRIIGYHITLTTICNSDGQQSQDHFLDFLLESKPGTIKVFYNLDYSIACLFKRFGADITEKDLSVLLNKQELYIAPYKFGYMSKKYFNVQEGNGKGSPFANFGDMYQFHRNTNMTELEPMQYAKKAYEIGTEVYNSLIKVGLTPKSLTSPVRCWEKEVLEEMDLPSMNDMPEEVATIAYNCCDGGWVESFQKGHWPIVCDYDIKSAYGSFTRQLLDTRAGKWTHSDFYDSTCYYGYALCNIDIDAPFSPIPYKTDDETIAPVGKWQRVLSKQYMDFIHKYKLGKIEVLDCWLWFPNKLVYPLWHMIDDLYQHKEKAVSAIEKDVTKRILAGIWGKFLQINQAHKKDQSPFGKLFNPVWAEQVETSTRLASAAFVLDNQLVNNVLHIAVDGVLTNKKVDIVETGQIGEWKMSSTGSGFVLSSGICALEGKDSPISETDNGDKDFILRYDWLLKQIQDKPNNTEYVLSKLSPVSIQKALTQDKLDIMGQHEDIIKTITIGFETKRDYAKLPETGNQLLHNKYISKPIDLDTVIKI